MIIDIHAHLWAGACEENKAEILRTIERYSITKVYVSGLHGYTPDPEQVAGINRKVAGFVRENPGSICGYVYISPEHDNAVEVLKRYIEEPGFVGVKLWVSTLCDDPCVNPVVEKAIDYGVPVLLHAFHKATGQLPNESVGINVRNLALRYPEAKLIMAHLGGNCYDGIPAIRDCENVWADISGSIFRADDLIYAVESIGADRILFGTDLPGSFAVNYGEVLEANISEDEKNKILYKNTLVLFDRNFKIKR